MSKSERAQFLSLLSYAEHADRSGGLRIFQINLRVQHLIKKCLDLCQFTEIRSKEGYRTSQTILDCQKCKRSTLNETATLNRIGTDEHPATTVLHILKNHTKEVVKESLLEGISIKDLNRALKSTCVLLKGQTGLDPNSMFAEVVERVWACIIEECSPPNEKTTQYKVTKEKIVYHCTEYAGKDIRKASADKGQQNKKEWIKNRTRHTKPNGNTL